MSNSDYYDPDGVVPRGSPLLAPFVPDLTPDTDDISDGGDTDLEDIIDIDTPWNRALRDNKRPHGNGDNTRPRRHKKEQHEANWKDAFLVHQMDPRQGWELGSVAAREHLEPLRQTRRPRKRFTLPLHIAGSHTPIATYTEVMACPDSGSDENIISLALVNELNLAVEPTSDEPRRFSVANGNIVQAIGQVLVSCRFAAGAPSIDPNLECVFQVFNVLAVPLIMGMNFLHETETLSKHMDRLVEQLIPGMQSLRVNSVGSSKRGIMCCLDGTIGCATVDTGSDLDLVSPDFAKALSFNVTPADELVEFADCSTATISGVVTVEFSLVCVDKHGVFRPQRETVHLDFYVLDNLNANILVGQDTINELNVFSKHTESFIYTSSPNGEPGVNIIRHKGKFEQQMERGVQKIKDLFTNSSNNSSGTTNPIVNQQRMNARREREQEQARHNPDTPTVSDGHNIPASVPRFSLMSLDSGLPVTSMSPVSPTSSTGATSGDLVEDMAMNEATTASNAPAGGYVCNYLGCTASPFQTQYLLIRYILLHSTISFDF
ncbi:hypothetical protein FALBO_624 [Fusarium albosuccineum]|uniref:Uncharacterized protein n=1 Tax=Fusarium albosuccineum TaxID=1237068 RepID=A0A8H4PEC5_9HYPO|nr:hypothetical protein FALBO_624 [Fusarium albosuccineum]